ncbi:hypothetical protein BDV93DRAFT_556026 [Ceratobasidium sp. AG-I]|nr:hypothetical protein BDV93DRAFT_556026 [Ceratobasidium sp. AG-I]
MAEAQMELGNPYDVYVDVPIHRQPGLGDAPYIQKTLDEIAPYIKQLHKIDLAVNDVQQLRLFLDFWLEKGAPGSVTALDLVLKKPGQVFVETNSRLSDRFSQCLRSVLHLSIYRVGLDWSSAAFDKLTSISLSNLPSSCCPTLVQLVGVLSTCPNLLSLDLERLTFPASLGPVPEPAKLGKLQHLYLTEIDLGSVLPVLSPKNSKLHLNFQSPIDDIDTLQLLLSFVDRASIHRLDLTLPEARSDQALVRLLHPFSNPLLDLQKLTLSELNLRDSELSELAVHSFVHDSATLASALVGTTSRDSQSRTLVMWHCTIHTSPEALHNAFSSLSWDILNLNDCHHFVTTQGADGAAETLVPINSTSEFGIRLSELLLNRLDFGYW